MLFEAFLVNLSLVVFPFLKLFIWTYIRSLIQLILQINISYDTGIKKRAATKQIPIFTITLTPLFVQIYIKQIY